MTEKNRVQLIAEFCQNHNGDFDLLRKMIDEAAEGGATHGKIQTIFADDVAYRDRFEDGKTSADGTTLTIKRPYRDEYERLRDLELSYEQHVAFIEQCRNVGLEPLTTCFNLTSIPHLKGMGWRVVKVASYDCGSLPLIDALANSFDELVISTGATYDEEIEKTAALLNDRNVPFSFLHCVTIYPTPLEDMHLRRLEVLSKLAPKVGLSDHSLVSRDGVKAALAAVRLGARVIERHFTVLPADETRDGPVSIRQKHLVEIQAFAALSPADQDDYLREHVPELETLLGSRERALSDVELLNRDYYRGRFCNKIGDRQVYNWEDDARSIAT